MYLLDFYHFWIFELVLKIIFDRVLKAGNSVLLASKMVIKNPEEVNGAIVNGKHSKEYFHRVTGHAGHYLMDATANY